MKKVLPTPESYTNIDEYIALFPAPTQLILKKVRKLIHDAAPGATEAISYMMPTFKLNGNLVHFAAYPHHIGFYPTPSAIVKFQKELAKYKTAKGSIQFPIDQPVPYELIKKIVQFRIKENLKK
jgi:uncharacterized protein YdhG (YjbR/CyaY superfamily)